MQDRHCFVCLLALVACSLSRVATGADQTAEAKQPNIVFILADDLGWTDVACYGSKYYETPNLDRMAAEGLRFTHGYTCGPNCQPTRAALMSGQYGPRTGIYTVGGTDRFDTSRRPLVPVENVTSLAPKTVTIAESLKRAGYATAMFGKWHLGQDSDHHPAQQGFDEAIVSMGKHFRFATSPKVDVPDDKYLADFLTEKAIDFVSRNKDRRFFLYLPHFGVHSPHEAKDNWIDHFRPKAAAGGHRDPVYAAMIASVDESVGRVLKTLDDLKLAENTLVIFSSDNGGVGGYQAAGIPKAGGITDNAPLRGGKGMLYEGGVRVPYIFRWPGHIAAGTVSDEPIISVDLYPTFLELARAQPPASQTLDGMSYAKLLTGSAKSLGERPIFWHFPGYLGAGQDSWRTTPAGAIQIGPWKLLEFFEDKRIELYNLREDVSQKNNLAGGQSDRAQELHAQLIAWRQAIHAPMPQSRANAAEPAAPAKAKKKAKRKAK